ncbi:MAG: histidine phosphatase family protein [Rhodobacteraceae bacterium]|nr:histidine phosphatase family protein [Paracoccaceae bacterium]
MSELLVIRHGQASFGADDYDQLSDLGHKQSAMLGARLRDLDWVPDRLVTGTLLRQKQTLASMGFEASPEEHAGFNEYDFHDLLKVNFGGEVPDQVRHDRKAHFRTLRQVIYEWQDGGLSDARECWAEFAARVQAARVFACDTDAKPGAKRVLVVSSGGPIGQLVACALQAPVKQMVALNLQVKNTSITRFFWSGERFTLNEFNATPHFGNQNDAAMMTYS